MITDADILTLQAHAVATDDMRLLDKCYAALGYGRTVPIVPTVGEVKQARKACEDAIQMMAMTGEQLRDVGAVQEAA